MWPDIPNLGGGGGFGVRGPGAKLSRVGSGNSRTCCPLTGHENSTAYLSGKIQVFDRMHTIIGGI